MRTLFVLFVVAHIGGAGVARADDCSGGWESFSSEPLVGTLFPDTHNIYFRIRFETPEGRPLRLRLRGRFPYARYMSFTVYDQATLDAHQSLPDKNIEPDPGNENPFRHGVNRKTERRNYTVQIVPPGTLPTPGENALELPGGNLPRRVEIWYRVYFPDAGSNSQGNVPVPSLEAVDFSTGKPARCPKRVTSLPGILPAFKNLPPEASQGRIAFYHPKANAIYSAPDNRYLISRLRTYPRTVSVFQFKPPTFSNTHAGVGSFDGSQEVRYWSLCLGGASTVTSECLADSNARVAPDGLVHVVVGPKAVAEAARKRGYNFIHRDRFLVPLVLYRNLLTRPGFSGDFANVPLWTTEMAADEPFQAQGYLGDYGPSGTYCPVAEFLSNGC